MDKIDFRILKILEKDGRITNSDLSERVGLSKTPCQLRVKSLIKSGIIKGFKAVLNNSKLDQNHIAFTEVKLNDTRDTALKSFNEAVQEIPEIEQCHMIAGKFDYLLKVRTKNIMDYRHTLAKNFVFALCFKHINTCRYGSY
jgi:Transcriptional regulators